MANRRSIFIVEHPRDTSYEVAFAEAMAIDEAVKALGLEVVAGSYAQEGNAHELGMRLVMGHDDA